ncbi:MAG: sulfite exporter TauE/SafE family protein [Thiobacillaceae bacterium]|nr:sulfite exporter TauE/SafE family protein [Thiobacillaceae bacterium]
MTGIELALWLIPAFFAGALLYASVGHGGASAYLAIMALAGLAPAEMKPIALMLNVVVATIGTYKYVRAGCFDARLLAWFALFSLPLAYVGGSLSLPDAWFKPVVGVVLLFAAWRMLSPAMSVRIAISGGAMGFLSGLTGVGGGIFLSPLVLLLGWASTRVTSGVAAAFILLNSLAGLAGFFTHGSLPQSAALPWWVLAVAAGGWLGAEIGSRRIAPTWIRRLLALVLAIAGSKLAFL